MALPGVKCEVSNCKFWQQGQHCNAVDIEVKVDQGQNNARTSDQTNCHTFMPQSS